MLELPQPQVLLPPRVLPLLLVRLLLVLPVPRLLVLLRPGPRLPR